MSNTTELENIFDWVKYLQTRVKELVKDWEEEEGNLIMILHAIQNEFGYIPRGVANEVAKALGIRLARIYEVITFYHYFRLTPPGQHKVQVCMGTACYLKGAMNLHDELARQLELLKATGMRDGEFHLETVRCIGCCGMAPAVVVDDQTHGRLKVDDAAKLLRQKRDE